jgi:hypothetical protein
MQKAGVLGNWLNRDYTTVSANESTQYIAVVANVSPNINGHRFTLDQWGQVLRLWVTVHQEPTPPPKESDARWQRHKDAALHLGYERHHLLHPHFIRSPFQL